MKDVHIEKLNGGYSLKTNRKLLCRGCKKELIAGNLYYCEQDDCFYCFDCAKEHHTFRNHLDWNIIKVVTD